MGAGLDGTRAGLHPHVRRPGPRGEIIASGLEDFEQYTVPLIELLRPDILQATEDICYNHGMLISPAHFEEFCSPSYRRVAEVAREYGVTMLAVDTDGHVMQCAPLLAEAGVNAMFPFEAKAGNDLFALREQYPDLILLADGSRRKW